MCPKITLSDLGVPPYEPGDTAEDDDWTELDSISDTDLFALQPLYNASENSTLSTNSENYFEDVDESTCSESDSAFEAWNEHHPAMPRDYIDDIIDYDLSSDYRSDTESDYVTSDEDTLSVSSGSAHANAPLADNNASYAGGIENYMKCPEVLYVMNRSGRLYIAEDMGTLRDIISTLDDEESDDVDFYQEDGPNNRRSECVTINVLRLDGTLENFSELDEIENLDENQDCPNVLYLFCWSDHLYITGDMGALRELINSLDKDEADYEYTGDNKTDSELADKEKTELNNSRRRCVTVSVLRI